MMWRDELENVISTLPRVDLPLGGPMGTLNAHVCVHNGVLHVYPKDGGWLGMKLDDVRADVAPWAD